MMKPHIAGITLGVRDVAKAKAFYGGVFAGPDGHLWKVVVGNPGQPLSE